MSSLVQKCLAPLHSWQQRLWLKRSFHRLPDTLIFDSAALTTVWNSNNPLSELRRETIQWSDVSEIWVYKKDCFAYDQMRMIFQTSESIVEITEDMSGWQELMDQLHTLVPGSTAWAEWFLRIFHPAFASNVTKIYDRNEKR